MKKSLAVRLELLVDHLGTPAQQGTKYRIATAVNLPFHVLWREGPLCVVVDYRASETVRQEHSTVTHEANSSCVNYNRFVPLCPSNKREVLLCYIILPVV